MIEEKLDNRQNSLFKILGASNHSKEEREENDYYATDPSATEMLLELEPKLQNVLEPCCGGGHISEVLKYKGINVKSSDLVDRGYGEPGVNFITGYDFWDGDIVTNPPYKYAARFVEHSLSIIPDGRKVVMFLKIQFLESVGRRQLFKDSPPKIVYVSSSRIKCARGGDFEKYSKDSSAAFYAWYVWEKGFKGDPIIKWFN